MDPKFPKISLVVVAVATLGLGLYSHYSSTWVKGIDFGSDIKLTPYKLCVVFGLQCPNISLERFFIGMIIVSFVWSIASLVIAFCLKDQRGGINIADKALHVLCGVLLFPASITYIVSAEQIRKLYGGFGNDDFRHLEKIEAAVLGILQVCLHLLIAIMLMVQSRAAQRNTPTATPAHIIVVDRPIMISPMTQKPNFDNSPPKYF